MNIAQQPYQQDFYAWTIHNAWLLRQGKLSEIDHEHIAEELEGMARSEKRQIANRLAVLLAHLLKWEHQPTHRSGSWRGTIKEQRRRLHKLLEENPSLRRELPDCLAEAYESALILAATEMGIYEDDLPQTCQFTLEQVLDNGFPEDLDKRLR